VIVIEVKHLYTQRLLVSRKILFRDTLTRFCVLFENRKKVRFLLIITARKKNTEIQNKKR
jgi:hypothetical protein